MKKHILTAVAMFLVAGLAGFAEASSLGPAAEIEAAFGMPVVNIGPEAEPNG